MTPVNFHYLKVNDLVTINYYYGKISHNSQRNEFIYINLQFFNVAIQWLNTIMFRFILYRLIIKRAYVIIGYINIIETIIFFETIIKPEVL